MNHYCERWKGTFLNHQTEKRSYTGVLLENLPRTSLRCLFWMFAKRTVWNWVCSSPLKVHTVSSYSTTRINKGHLQSAPKTNDSLKFSKKRYENYRLVVKQPIVGISCVTIDRFRIFPMFKKWNPFQLSFYVFY